MFVCVYIRDFPVEAVLRVEADLRGQAVAVVDGVPPVVTVVAGNGRARAVGAEAGITELQAQERLRMAGTGRWTVKRRSTAQEESAHRALLDCACGFSPQVEAFAPDTVIADIAGLEKVFGSPAKIARDLARRCSDIGLEAHVAVAANPDVAMHAARGYAGITLIPAGEEAQRLGPLPLEVLVAPEYGKKKAARTKAKAVNDSAEMLGTLERWGVRTLRGLAALPEVAVVERLGQVGLQWQRFAQGATRRELVLAERPLHFEEVYELEDAVDLLEPLVFLLARMLDQLCARLQSRALATHELKLRLQLDPAVTLDREGAPIESAKESKDPFLERTIQLPVPMLDAKTFLKLLQLDLIANPPTAPVLKLWLRAEPVRPRFDQRGLFLPLTPEPQKLEITLARLAGIAGGSENVGSPEVLDTHRPDAFRMKRFAPPAPDYRPPKEKPAARPPASALRRFRPPQPVSVQTSGERPVAIGPPRTIVQSNEITRTLYGDVVWCAGPWRASGEWWNQEPWEREEWDIAISKQEEVRCTKWTAAVPIKRTQFGGMEVVAPASIPREMTSFLFRLYRDLQAGTWFVEGEYD